MREPGANIQVGTGGMDWLKEARLAPVIQFPIINKREIVEEKSKRSRGQVWSLPRHMTDEELREIHYFEANVIGKLS
jgi:hypothetical protein